MLIFPDGRIEGTIGGGDMESRVIKESLSALDDGKTRVLGYERVVGKGAWNIHYLCPLQCHTQRIASFLRDYRLRSGEDPARLHEGGAR